MNSTTKRYSFRALAGLLCAALCLLSFAPPANAAHVSIDWTAHSAPMDSWFGITWSSERNIFVAVAPLGTNQVMTSPDGVTWTPQTAASAAQWRSVTWSPELNLFVAVASTGANRVMTSPDGVTWAIQTAPEDSEWWSVVWSPELNLFVSVARSGTNQVMTSPDGATWTTQITAPANNWFDVTWSPQLGIFVAVGTLGVERVITSTDGVTWTPQPTGAGNAWLTVAWSPELDMFAALGTSDIMSSPDGVTWTQRGTGTEFWSGVTWSPELDMFAAVSVSGTNDITTSDDAITWHPTASPEDNPWQSIAWSPELGIFVSVAYDGTNRVMIGTPVATIPNAPLNLKATNPGPNQISLTWDPATSDNPYTVITGYKIERSTDGGAFEVLVANSNNTNTAYLDTVSGSVTRYAYRVSAINGAGTGPSSNVASIAPSLAATGMNMAASLTIGALITSAGVVLVLIERMRSKKLRH